MSDGVATTLDVPSVLNNYFLISRGCLSHRTKDYSLVSNGDDGDGCEVDDDHDDEKSPKLEMPIKGKRSDVFQVTPVC